MYLEKPEQLKIWNEGSITFIFDKRYVTSKMLKATKIMIMGIIKHKHQVSYHKCISCCIYSFHMLHI